MVLYFYALYFCRELTFCTRISLNYLEADRQKRRSEFDAVEPIFGFRLPGKYEQGCGSEEGTKKK